MVLGKLLWKGVKFVAKKVIAHAKREIEYERRMTALNVQVKGEPPMAYTSFGQASEAMIIQERWRKANAEARAVEREKQMRAAMWADACREQRGLYDAIC